MSDILFAFSAGLGPLSRCLPIANVLGNRKHRVHFCAIDKARVYMESFGHAFVPVATTAVLEIATLPTRTTTYPNLSTYYGFLGYTDPVFVRRKLASWLQALEPLRLQAIVSDCNLEAVLAAKVLGLPLVVISQSAFHPQRSLRFWEDHHPENEAVVGNLNALLREHGVASDVRRVEELFVGHSTIYTSIPELDPAPDDAVVYTGPILWDGYGGNLEQGATVVRRLRALEGKLVTVYTGRMADLVSSDAGALLVGLLSRLSDERDYSVVIATGGLDDVPPEVRRRSSERVVFTSWVPGPELYDSDLIIHHGGHGSCLASLVYGTRTLVLPTHSEREHNARQLSALGIGGWLDPRAIDSQMLHEEISRLVSNSVCQESATRWATTLRARHYRGEQLGADVIESHL